MSTELKNAHLSNVMHRLEQQNERIQELAGGLSKEQLEWIPPEGGWCIGKILEHLITTAESYYDVLPARIQKARNAGQVDSGKAWKKTRMANFMIKTLEGPRKVKTFKRFDPQGVEDRVVERLLDAQMRIAGFVRDADGLDLNKIRMSSPALWLIRYNLADCFEILVVHTKRHLNRVEEIIQAVEFPVTASV